MKNNFSISEGKNLDSYEAYFKSLERIKPVIIKVMARIEESESLKVFSESVLTPMYRGTIAGMTMQPDRTPAYSQAREDSLEEGTPTKTDRLEISYISGGPDYASSIPKRRRRKKSVGDFCLSSLTDTKHNNKHIYK